MESAESSGDLAAALGDARPLYPSYNETSILFLSIKDGSKGKKQKEACLRCTMRKAKCSENRPCVGCFKAGKVCEDIDSAARDSLSKICCKLQSVQKYSQSPRGTSADIPIVCVSITDEILQIWSTLCIESADLKVTCR
jgi:hypothetical protein